MKFLLAAAFLSTIYSQEIITSDGQVARPPIQIYDEDTGNQKNQIKSDSQSIVTTSDQIKQSIAFGDLAQLINQIIKDQQPLNQSVKKDQQSIEPEYIVQPLPMPMPPAPIQKFQETKQEPILIIDPVPLPIPQPIPFIQPQTLQEANFKHKKDEKHKKHDKSAKKYQNNDPFITQPNYDKKKQKLDHKKKKHLRKDKKKTHQKQERGQFIAGNQFQYENFEKQYQNGKHNKNMCFVFFLVGLISTLFGLCVGKHVRKCKKNKCKKAIYVNQERPLSQIQQQIVEKQRVINELKEQYRNKRAAEDTLAQIKRQDEAISRTYEAQMRQMKQRRQQNYIQPPQRYMAGHNEHIPMGRPINASKNSSFACEYPQL